MEFKTEQEFIDYYCNVNSYDNKDQLIKDAKFLWKLRPQADNIKLVKPPKDNHFIKSYWSSFNQLLYTKK